MIANKIHLSQVRRRVGHLRKDMPRKNGTCMENEADIPGKCQHEGEIKKKASSEMTVQGHEGAVPGHRGNSGGT